MPGMVIHRCVVVLLSGLVCAAAQASGSSAGVHSVSSPPPAESSSSENHLTVDQLVDALGSPEYGERERATEILKSRDKPFTEELKRIYRTLGDHEIRLRLREVAEHIFMRQALEHMGGFLGISLQAIDHRDDTRLDNKQAVIRIVTVLPGTAADRAGLSVGDLILAVEGDEFVVSRGNPGGFIDLIGAKPPGTELRLTLLRGADILARTVVLGKKPLTGLGRIRLQPEQMAAYENARREFARWCADLGPAP